MEQVSLNIVPRLPYSGGNFVNHSGVCSVLDSALAEIVKGSFSLIYVRAPERYGKTHLLVKISEELSRRDIFHRSIEGSELGILAYQLQTENNKSRHPQAILIDNLESYLLSVKRGESGEFVSFIEWCRLNKIPVVLFSSREIEEFPSDDHVKSRLRAGLHLLITEPEDQDIPLIIESLARQRGVKLNHRNIRFLSKRLARDILSLERYVERLLHLSQVLGKSIKFDLVSDAV